MINFPHLAVWRFAGFAKSVEAFELARKERFLLGARPALELRFSRASFGKCGVDFEKQDGDRWIPLSGSAGLAGRVIREPLLKVFRRTDVKRA